MTSELLRDIAAGGYPTDYLRARIQGRRAALAAQWSAVRARGEPIGVTDDVIWTGLLRELGWLRTQMSSRLRASLDPVVGLFELKTVVLCLRDKAARRGADIERLLADSQVSDDLRRALLREADVREAIAAIDAALAPAEGGALSLQRSYAEAGLKGFETRLTRQYLERVALARLRPGVRRFFAFFVDLRNLMTLYKQLRWGADDAEAYIAGGTIEIARMQQIGARKDAAGLDLLVRKLAGRTAPPVATAEGALESILLRSLTSEVRRIAGEGDEVSLVLDYAWRVYIHARSRSILLHAANLDPATIDKELVA
jgi:hypothetical protein